MSNVDTVSDDENIERPPDKFETHTFTTLCFDSDNESDEYNSSCSQLENLDLTDEEREKLILEYSETNINLITESLQNLFSNYVNDNNEYIEKIIGKICSNPNVPFTNKIYFSKQLENPDYLYSIINQVDWNNIDINHTLLWDACKYLQSKEKNVDFIFKHIISDTKLNIEYRYTLIRNDIEVNYLLKDFILSCKEDEYIFVIYTLQLMKKYNILDIDYCFEIYKNIKLSLEKSDNLKADFADFLLTLENEECKKLAITLLGEISNETNFYKNKQNIHLVDTNIKEFMKTINNAICNTTEQNTLTSIHNNCLTNEQKISLKRIQLDNTIYDTYTLSTVLYKLYWYIQSHEYKVDLMNILYQELNDMSYTCSSGHFIRLMNVLSGYENYIIIDPKKECKTTLYHMLQNKIENNIYSEEILDAIMNKDETQITKYLSIYFVDIRNILVEQYKDIMSIEVIEEEIRKGIIQFTLGET